MASSSSSSSSSTIFFGRFIDAPSANDLRIRTGAVLVSRKDGSGVIEKADWTVNGPNDAASKLGVEAPVVTAGEDGFFFPGFIDTHIHAPQYPNCGIFGKSTLLDWLETYTFPLESSLGTSASPMWANASSPDPLARAKTVYSRVIARTLSHGTTTASYFATLSVPATNLLADLAFKKGQRAYVGRVCMDLAETCPHYYRDESTEESVANARASIEHCRAVDPTGELVAPIITPRFAPSCMTSTLSALGDLAREQDLRVQTHISENVNEVALVKSLFPERNSYTDVYDHSRLLTPRTILAHAIHLSSEEMDTIRARQAKVSHCPASNSALGSGFCPVRDLLDRGIDVGLGTDVSGGYHPSILDAARQACLVSRHVGFVRGGDSRYNVGVTEALWLGTVGGAKVVGMEGRLGTFEEGMLWDAQEISLGRDVAGGEDADVDVRDGGVDVFGWETWEDRVAKWLWSGDDRNVVRVWVGGRLVHELKSR
ncbi:guanine deaminase [Cyphellophora europaea CBS 101466]|uniref:Probable guanine deaminase n=1 Tax=Cyphellophora europaea (strain CBS 101466) TaxID=1220924 RepID=W2RQZ2_CYPE1|nr:guanine deaminase [Cyphellophora europaea CBS 101466]ETN38143.1 guanine deaminase [Cyphellophora europaea CBS 101466]